MTVKVHTVGWSARRDPDDHDKRITELTVYRWPLWVWLLDEVAQLACVATRHRFCNIGFSRIERFLWSKVETFDTVVPESEIERFERWRHQASPYWVDDDPDQPVQIAAEGFHRY